MSTHEPGRATGSEPAHALSGTAPAPTGAVAAAGPVAAASMTQPQEQELTLAQAERRCEVCGNHYDKAFRVVHRGASHVFDCFECAIHALAPTCAHCGCKIVGHGSESDGVMYCCAHCAQRAGVGGLKDRADGAS